MEKEEIGRGGGRSVAGKEWQKGRGRKAFGLGSLGSRPQSIGKKAQGKKTKHCSREKLEKGGKTGKKNLDIAGGEKKRVLTKKVGQKWEILCNGGFKGRIIGQTENIRGGSWLKGKARRKR